MLLRPRRSVIYVPGDNPRAMTKVRGLDVDGVILDLEDSVPGEGKEHARAAVEQTLADGGFGWRERIVRVNGLGTPWFEPDLEMAARARPDAVLIPKVEGPEAPKEAAAILDALSAPKELALWCMIETPRAVLRAEAIAGAARRVGVLVMGTSDLGKELRVPVTQDRLPLLHSLSHCILVARAYQLGILDGVHLDLEDEEGLILSARQGNELGFDGKTLIHPSQIAAANAAFSPSPEEIEWSELITRAHEDALASGRGVVLVGGKLVESLHVEAARRILAIAGAISARPAPAKDPSAA